MVEDPVQAPWTRQYRPTVLTAAGVSMLVMRVGGDSPRLIPQIHQGSATTHKRGGEGRGGEVPLFLSDSLWNERISIITIPRRGDDRKSRGDSAGLRQRRSPGLLTKLGAGGRGNEDPLISRVTRVGCCLWNRHFLVCCPSLGGEGSYQKE